MAGYIPKCPAPGIEPGHTVTHPSTNRARSRLTSLIESDALPLRQPDRHLMHVSRSAARSLYLYPCASGWVGKHMCVSVHPRIDPLCFLARYRQRRLNQGLVVVVLNFSVTVRQDVFLCCFLVSGCMLCLPFHYHYQSNIDRLRRFVSEMTCYVLSETLISTNLL